MKKIHVDLIAKTMEAVIQPNLAHVRATGNYSHVNPSPLVSVKRWFQKRADISGRNVSPDSRFPQGPSYCVPAKHVIMSKTDACFFIDVPPMMDSPR